MIMFLLQELSLNIHIQLKQITQKHRANPTCRSSRKPSCQFTPLIDIVDHILNALLDEELIELPPIVDPKFPNDVPSHVHYKEICNYHRVPSHLT